jgi:hypothetical protein
VGNLGFSPHLAVKKKSNLRRGLINGNLNNFQSYKIIAKMSKISWKISHHTKNQENLNFNEK